MASALDSSSTEKFFHARFGSSDKSKHKNKCKRFNEENTDLQISVT